MTDNPYLTHYVHGCRRFRKFGDYWLSQLKVHPSKEKMDVACEHYAKRYPDAIVKVFKVRCHGRSWVYGIYWIHPEQMKQQDKERKGAESQMGDCYMCDKPAVFIAHDLPTGEKPFCSELHFCQYACLTYRGEGYYGFTDPAKVKEPARLARARKRLKYAETENKWKVGDKVKILNNELGNEFDIGEIVTLIENEAANSWRAKNDEGEEWHIEENGCGILVEDKNTNPRKARLQKRFGLGSETFEAPRTCALCGVSGHNRRTCPTKGINPFSNGDTIICKKDSGGRHKIFVVDDLAKYMINGDTILLLHPNGLKTEFDDIDDVKTYFEVYDPTDEKYQVGLYPMLMKGRIKEYEQRFGSIQPTKQKYIPKYKVGDMVFGDGGRVRILIIGVDEDNGAYHRFTESGEIVKMDIKNLDSNSAFQLYVPKYKVGDILIDRGTRDKAIIVDYTSAKGEYHWKYLEGGAKGIFLDTPFEDLDTDIDYELYVQPNTNPRKARLKKRFGFGSETFSSENGELQLKESIKRTKMSMIRTGLAITTFTIVMWNLWTNKKQEKDISEIMDMI